MVLRVFERWTELKVSSRTAAPGLFVMGVCGTAGCKAFNDDVVCNFGYSKGDQVFALNKMEYMATCPVCKQRISVRQWYANRSTVAFDGWRTAPEPAGQVKRTFNVGNFPFVISGDKDEKRCKYAYLDVKVTPWNA
jgi:hypothetical protein